MGRQLRRVPLDFNWPINKTWAGFLNPHYEGHCSDCKVCGGTGGSPDAERIKNLWYGYASFKPEDRGSKPFLPTDAPVRAFAERHVANSPTFYGTSEACIVREATRLCELFNGQMSHHLNEADIAALLAAGRLVDFTHMWTKDTGWVKKSPEYVPTVREVNDWSVSGGMGHDSINQWVVTQAECLRLGVSDVCLTCNGEGAIWDSEENEAICEAWAPEEPPKGPGYQMWQTVSEGSPISPVFETPQDLAEWLVANPWGIDEGTTVAQWLAFIHGPGWAPSFVCDGVTLSTGVQVVEAA